MLLTQLLATVTAKNPLRPAIRYLGKEMNYTELKKAIARLSYLYQNEIGQCPRVAFIARNSPAYAVTFIAITNIRGVCIPMDPDKTDEELATLLKDSRATHIAVTNDLISRVREIQTNFRLSLPLVEMEKKQGGEYDTSFTTPPEHQPTENDVILLLKSAGISGKPHFVAFTHKQISHAVTALKPLYHLSLTDRFLISSSWAHPFAFTHGFLFPLLTGATVVIDHGMDPTQYLSFLIESHVNRLLGPPSFFHRLLVLCKNENRPLVGVKSITVVGGNLSPELAQLYNRMKVAVSHCYGQTENLWTIAMGDAALPLNSDGTVAFETETPTMKGLAGIKYKVVDQNGDEIPAPDTRIGQLALTGPTIMNRYDGADKALEKETKNALRGTWLYTGDIVRLDGDHDTLQITFIGRKKDILANGGDFIPMGEITRALKEVPGVQDAAAFVTFTSRDEPVIAGAVMKVNGANITEKTILEFLTKSLFEDQMPKVIVFTDTIPKDFGGNPNYGRLRNMFSGVAG